MQQLNRSKRNHSKKIDTPDNVNGDNAIIKREAIFKAFYQDYQKTRQELFTHLRDQNSELNAFVIFEKTQKILDRIVIICFCADSDLVQYNAVRKIVQRAKHSGDMNGTTAWNQLKSLFRSIEKGILEMAVNNRFNDSLFKEDTVLDQLTVQDTIFPIFEKITCYDFTTNLDVSVLGYIFEQSINDAEEMQAVMTGENDDLQQRKRKKDGIFYTSPGVIDLLLQETLLKWIDDRKQELDQRLPGDDTEQQIELNRKLLQSFRSIKVLDPSAGSGAFLNRAFDTLVQEGNKINQILEEVKEGQAKLFDFKRYILNHNLFGVDLNEKSIDIAKLSLWLKTGNRHSELTSLNDNLKTGNAIIGHPDISDQAFDWHQEFPEIMDGGGFDVIIGNPPYIFARNEGFTKAEKSYFNSHYELVEYQINTYLLFIERSYHLLKEDGWLGFIVPNNLLTIDSCKKIRRFLLEHTGNLTIINIHSRMFEQADVDTCLLIFQKRKPTTVKLGEYTNDGLKIVAEVDPEVLLDEGSIINISLMKNQRLWKVLSKIETANPNLGSVATVKSGLVAYEVGRGNPEQTREMKENRVYHSDFQVDDTYWKYVEGRDVCRYSLAWDGSWLKYGPNLAAGRNEAIFTRPRILVRQIPSKSKYAIHAVYTEKEILNDRNSNNIIDFQKAPLFLLGVINSKITTFWFICKFDKFQRQTFPQFKVKDLKMFPVPDVSESDMKQISEAVDQMLHVQRQKREVVQPTEEINQKEKRLNEQIDTFVAAAFGLTDEDVQLIDAHLEEFLE